MKKFLKFMPLAAALLFATSCDKDENNDTKSDNGLVIVPFTVKVETGSKVSKIAYAESEGAFTPSFEEKEVGSLTMTLTSEELGNKILTLQDLSGTFSGDLEMTKEQKTQFDEGKIKFVGTIGTALPAPVPNTTSLKNLIEECTHQYKTAEFASNATTGIGLTDQNSYLAITWTNKGGASVEFTINGSETPVSITLNNDGQGWIAVPGGATVACADLEITSATTTVGKIHNISREFSAVPEGYVDLGLTSGNLWAAENYSSDGNTTFKYAQACALDGIPTSADFEELYTQCLWVWDATNKGYNVFKSKSDSDKGKVTPTATYDVSTDPHIFLPAAFNGNRSGTYWSSILCDDDSYAYCLYFYSFAVIPKRNYNVEGFYSVRLVRRSN